MFNACTIYQVLHALHYLKATVQNSSFMRSIFIHHCGLYTTHNGNCRVAQSFSHPFVDERVKRNTYREFQQYVVAEPCEKKHSFSCLNGRCVVLDWLLDGTDDCEDGSDEGTAHARRNLHERGARTVA